VPTTLYLISDGRFPEVGDVRLKDTEAVFLPVGRKQAANVAVMAFAVRRHETDPTRLQAIARLRNFGRDNAEVDVDLLLGEDDATRPEDGRLIDAARMTIPPDEQRGAAFDIGGIEQGVLWLTASTGDMLAADDRAQVVVRSSRRGRVLLVTPGDESLELALSTDAARRRAELTVRPPSYLESDDYRRAAASGTYDLIVYDRCAPEQMPQSNTWLLGAAPPGEMWQLGERRDVPQVIDAATVHPLLAWAGVADVLIVAGRPIEPPPAADVLIDTDVGPMMAIGTRGMFQDLVTGFSLVEQAEGDDGKMQTFLGTNWQWRPSFPVFVMNLLEYLGGADARAADTTIRPGEPVVIDTPGIRTELSVVTPDGERHTLTADASGRATVTRTEQLGVYRVETDGKPLRQFAVNLFDANESRIAATAAESVQLGTTEAVAQTKPQPARRETWRWWLLAGLIVVTGEWWIYNRRVYL